MEQPEWPPESPLGNYLRMASRCVLATVAVLEDVSRDVEDPFSTERLFEIRDALSGLAEKIQQEARNLDRRHGT